MFYLSFTTDGGVLETSKLDNCIIYGMELIQSQTSLRIQNSQRNVLDLLELTKYNQIKSSDNLECLPLWIYDRHESTKGRAKAAYKFRPEIESSIQWCRELWSPA